MPVGNVVEQLGSEYNKQHYVYNDNVTYRKLTNTLWRIERVENAEGYIGYNIQQNSNRTLLRLGSRWKHSI